MQIGISDPLGQTIFFSALLIIALVFSIRKTKDQLFSNNMTDELKGLAILAVIFSHIGYFLSPDPRFLFPLSTLAGVGVNLFLVLSGFGLTLSQLNKPLTPLDFYKRRFKKLYLPLWITLISFYFLDFFIHHRVYRDTWVIGSFLGIFPRADLFQSIDSPLWYFSWILLYYLLFPWVVKFSKSGIIIPLLFLVLGWMASHFPLRLVNPDVSHLYSLHYLAFPLGVFLAFYKNQVVSAINKIHFFWKLVTCLLLLATFSYLTINSGVGTNLEQLLSIITTLIIIGVFSLKSFSFRLLSLFGILSYEIYLFHWPILSRYDFLYSRLPAGLATALYLIFFLILGWLMRRLVNITDLKGNEFKRKS